ncbi:MAG: NAD(P)H-dependent glycerol-3-phosphate dehydrogenase [Bacteroidia bacterium]|nr:NAD(P)H-dependent glycerol-3-phosphate dehydrogenase [Bacteroidia bacterium]
MPDFTSVAVIGGGSWGTAIVKMLSGNLENVDWWLRQKDSVDHILKHKHNPSYLSDVEIDLDHVSPTDDLVAAIKNNDVIILAIPSAFLHDTLEQLDSDAMKGKVIFSAIKGIVPQKLQIVGEYIHESFNVSYDNIGVITGPCHAEEVALEKLSYLTIACQNTENAEQMAHLLERRFVNTKVSDDIYGTEFAAVLKNVIAIASGICNGVGYGDNFQAVLLSNAIREIKRFVDVVHPIDRDIKGSAYLGDLLVTAYSQFSRNRTFGNMIGKGYSVKSAMMEMNMIAEGYYAVKCVYEINKDLNVSMPITEAVYHILYEQISPRIEMKLLSDKLD